MSELEILVARHGQTDWNRDLRWQGLSDIPLNEVGLEQAHKLGERLRDEGILRIYSSDLKRATETASVVSGILHIDHVYMEERLRERFLGIFEGWHSPEVARYAGIPEEQYRVLETDELRIDGLPEVELWSDFVRRIWAAFNSIAVSSSGEKSLIIAHGGVMRAISASITMDTSVFEKFSNCQIMRISKNNGSWHLEND